MSRALAAARARAAARLLPDAPPQVLVVLDGDARFAWGKGGAPQTADARLAKLLADHAVDRVQPLGPGAARRASGRQYLRLSSSRPQFDARTLAAQLRASGVVRAAIVDQPARLYATLPNDNLLPQQWHIDDTAGADVHLPEAWDLVLGSSSVTIGIMDTGVDVTHPDLAASIWTNPGEVAGNGVDDDGNGYIDDVHGWDFGGHDSDPLPHPTFDPSGIDVGFHGTHCAGIAAAVTDNLEGVAGASWGCTIVPLKVTDPATGQILDSAIAEAFLYAADNGVDVLSMSFGAPDSAGVREFFQPLVDDATAAGVLCVAAAGNDGTSDLSFPAANDGVLAVAATDETNARAFFSNFGPWVDIGAPGSQILSTISQNYEVDFISQFFYIFLFGWDGVSPYMLADGTSMACPLTAGVAALVKSQAPALTPAMLAQVLVDTGDAVPFDQPIGPKLNAFAAVQVVLARTAAPETPGASLGRGAGLQLMGVSPNPFNPRAEIRFTLEAPSHVRAELLDAAGRRVRTLLEAPLSAGPHALVWDGRDGAGCAVASGVYHLRLEAGGAAAGAKLVLTR